MNKNKMKILAYVAGIIDGEGHIGIAKQSHPNCETRKRNAEYNLRVAVKMCDGKVIDYLYGNFGGHVGTRPAMPPRHIQYYWVINCKKAAQLLKQLIPFLVGKKEQAELAIRFQSRKKQNVRVPIEIEETEYKRMKELHDTYHTCAGVETKRNERLQGVCDSPNLQEL